MDIMKYTNGTGHLIISVVVIASMTFLIYTKSMDVTAAMGILGTVVGFWFLAGAANRIAPQNPTAPPQVQEVRVEPNTPAAGS